MNDTVKTTALRDLRPKLQTQVPDSAMVLAAGLGTRMAPLTDTRPKALVEVAGRSLIDRALDRLAAAGVKTAVVNLHHFADRLQAHLSAREGPPDIVFSDERDRLLETGGGIKKALPLMGEGAFFTVNCDALWLDGLNDTLMLMASAWDPARMDCLLLIVPAVSAVAYFGTGDFQMDGLGRLTRKPPRTISPYLFGGIAIMDPALAAAEEAAVFSSNRLFDRAEAAGRLFGVIHEGRWAHVGTPDAVRDAERALFD